MGQIFGKSKKSQNSKISDADRAVLELKKCRDQLKQYQKKIQGNMEKEREVARELMKADKIDKAKLVLKKKRVKEKLMETTDQQLDNLDRMVQEIEMAQIQTEVVAGIKNGKDCLKALQDLMKLEDVEKLMDDTEEAVTMQQQIDEALAKDMATGALSNYSDDDILAELDLLVQQEQGAGAKTGDVVSPSLPDVPSHDMPEDETEPVAESEPKRVALAA